MPDSRSSPKGPTSSQAGRPWAAEYALAALPLPAVLLAGAGGRADLTALLAWLTLSSGAAACLAGGAGARWSRLVPLAAIGWGAAAAAAVALGPQRQAEPSVLSALAGLGPALGLAALGGGLGSRRPRQAPGLAAALLAAAALLCALPGRADRVEAGWAERRPGVAAALLDVSPLTVAAEAAGIDWMRHPAVYGPAGTDWFSDRRRPHGPLAGAVALVVGCALGFASASVRRPRTTDLEQTA